MFVRVPVKFMRAAVAQDVIRTFSEHAIEAHACNSSSQFIIVYQFCISKYRSAHTKMVMNFLHVVGDLRLKLIARHEAGERMIICFCKKFYRSGSCQRPETGQYLGAMRCQLINNSS